MTPMYRWLPCLPLVLLLIPSSASAEWISPLPRPYVAFVGTFSDTSGPGLSHFQSPSRRTDVFSQMGVEVGWPVAGELTFFGRLTGMTSKPSFDSDTPELRVLEPTAGLSFAYPILPWVLPAAAVGAGMARQAVDLGGTERYSAVDWVPVAGGRAGLELRTPGLLFDEDRPDGLLGQGSLALFVGYGYTFRGSADFGALHVSGEHEGRVHGPRVGDLDLSGHGFDVRMHFRF